MEIKSIFKKALPLIIGILIGAGITRNKSVFLILIVVMLLMFLRNILLTASKGKTKKQSMKKAVGISFLNWYITQVEGGFTIADKLYDNFYSTWIMVVNVCLLIFGIMYLIKGDMLWGFILLFSMQVIMTQNQIWRKIKDGKSIKKAKQKA